jgi:hypothetical protein
MPKLPIQNTDTPGSRHGTLGSPDALLPQLVDATTNLSAIGPLLLPCRVLAFRDSLPPGLVGAYVTLLGARDSLHVGVLADDASCIALARRMSATTELDSVSVRSRMCDIARNLGRALAHRIGGLHIAVSEPVFVDGIARRTSDVGLRAAEVVLGGTRATLVVVARRNDAESGAWRRKPGDDP